ncbi:Fluoride export protein 1 [Fusarium oxysporum f. sp. rapae]|uniref:Fluoride export protein 1 n=1 Tax=Fusarium oxysporum f. sp. rapae TaxID=485398 RepID=A0A8J5U0C2_FUSOX|nr:Fluoride export protein 1 [Fusarium oxysporum f. sp. rapae]
MLNSSGGRGSAQWPSMISRSPGSSGESHEYGQPDKYTHLGEPNDPSPVESTENRDEAGLPGSSQHEVGLDHPRLSTSRRRGDNGVGNSRDLDPVAPHPGQRRRQSHTPRSRSHHSELTTELYDVPDEYFNLNEVGSPLPVENPDERPVYCHHSLEERYDRSSRSSISRRNEELGIPSSPPLGGQDKRVNDRLRGHTRRVSRIFTELYTVSYITFLSILGTLARLGLESLTFYIGAPVTFATLWVNFAGTLILGLLSESSAVFSGETSPEKSKVDAENSDGVLESSSRIDNESNREGDTDIGATARKPVPLFIGLSTGFCGSLTTFSSFMRDVFLALSNSLPVPQYYRGESSEALAPRGVGVDIMALLAVILTTLCMCLSALKIGAHIAILLNRRHIELPFRLRVILDRCALLLGFGTWLGAVLIAVFPPDRPSDANGHDSRKQETWRGQGLFAVVFAPLGSLLRFYISLKLNSLRPAFPLGTFTVNVVGTGLLGMAWDLQRAHLGPGRSVIGGSEIGCQLLQGVVDGFCGCLTTVSTWVAELSGLHRWHAYMYGTATVVVSLAVLVVIMGTMKWTVGWNEPICVTA